MDVVGMVSSMVMTDLAGADLVGVREHLARVSRVRSWLDAEEISARRRLEDFRAPFGATPDQEFARASNKSRSDADKVNARAKTAGEVPQLGVALGEGAVTGAHLDVLERGLRGLDRDARQKLIDDEGERLARLACRQSPDEFARTVKDTVTASRDDGGIANLERQKRAARLRAWTDQFTGMIHLSGQFDPESGLKLLGRLRNKVEELFHDKVPDTCPTDPSDKQDHLRALALISILDGNGTGTGTGSGTDPAYRRRSTATRLRVRGRVGRI